MRKYLYFVLVTGLLFGCAKKKEGSNDTTCFPVDYLKATVVQTSNIDCNKPLLDFTGDSAKIHRVTGSPAKQFIIDNLPAEFNTLNRELFVVVSPLEPEKEFPCKTLGIPYPHLKLLQVKNRE